MEEVAFGVLGDDCLEALEGGFEVVVLEFGEAVPIVECVDEGGLVEGFEPGLGLLAQLVELFAL